MSEEHPSALVQRAAYSRGVCPRSPWCGRSARYSWTAVVPGDHACGIRWCVAIDVVPVGATPSLSAQRIELGYPRLIATTRRTGVALRATRVGEICVAERAAGWLTQGSSAPESPQATPMRRAAPFRRGRVQSQLYQSGRGGPVVAISKDSPDVPVVTLYRVERGLLEPD